MKPKLVGKILILHNGKEWEGKYWEKDNRFRNWVVKKFGKNPVDVFSELPTSAGLVSDYIYAIEVRKKERG